MPPVSRKPAFDLLVLGSSGGPLETDVPAYALKPADTAWEDGWVGLEGGQSYEFLMGEIGATSTYRIHKCG
jgi:hypothetical protein